MLFDQPIFIGIDTSGSSRAFTWAALDRRQEVLALRQGSLEEILAFLGGLQQCAIAINAPRPTPLRLMADESIRAELNPTPPPGRFISHRICEYLLRTQGLRVPASQSESHEKSPLIRNGNRLYQRLSGMVFSQILETFTPGYFSILLGISPFQRTSLEGRIQRQLTLLNQSVRLADPMEYFEEVTRHRLLRGILPQGIVHTPRELDAMAAANIAFLSTHEPEKLQPVGDERDGLVWLPVKPRAE